MSTGVTNFYFNNFQASQEQLLLEELVIEAISIYGQDMYYIPRTIGNLDPIRGEDDQSSYNSATMIAMYIKSIDGFSGDGEFMSKFGLEIRDQVKFSVAQRIFAQEIGSITNQPRPNEGDLIYFPLNQKCFQIKYVNKFEMFYQLGALQTWEMTCELFEYAGEQFNTGLPFIDSLQQDYSLNILDWTILTEDGNYLVTQDYDYLVNELFNEAIIDPLAENDEIQLQSDSFIDFSEHDPFSETGTF